MKKLNWILFATLVVSLSACNKESEPVTEGLLIQEITMATGRAPVEPAELPEPILAYIRDIYFDTYIETAFQAPSRGFELNMGNGENLFFDWGNNLLESRGPCNRPASYGNPIAVERLPHAVVRYVNANYPGSDIRRAATRSGYFIVSVGGARAILLFDEQGAFVEELSPIRHCQDNCRPVRADQLPAAIPAYIRANYNDVTFRQACARGGRIAVWLTNAAGRIILVFDREGNLLFVRG